MCKDIVIEAPGGQCDDKPQMTKSFLLHPRIRLPIQSIDKRRIDCSCWIALPPMLCYLRRKICFSADYYQLEIIRGGGGGLGFMLLVVQVSERGRRNR